VSALKVTKRCQNNYQFSFEQLLRLVMANQQTLDPEVEECFNIVEYIISDETSRKSEIISKNIPTIKLGGY